MTGTGPGHILTVRSCRLIDVVGHGKIGPPEWLTGRGIHGHQVAALVMPDHELLRSVRSIHRDEMAAPGSIPVMSIRDRGVREHGPFRHKRRIPEDLASGYIYRDQGVCILGRFRSGCCDEVRCRVATGQIDDSLLHIDSTAGPGGRAAVL